MYGVETAKKIRKKGKGQGKGKENQGNQISTCYTS